MPVRYADPEELASLLGTMVPDASISVEQGGLMVRGTPGQIDLVKELFAELDVPLSEVSLDVHLVVWEGVAPAQLWVEDLPGGLVAGSLHGGVVEVDRQALARAFGSANLLLHKTFPANLGESGRLSLSASESDVQIELWYRPVFREPNKIQSHIQIAIVGTRRPYTFHRDFKDGETVCIKGFLPTQNVRGEAAEVVLMLTPHLMR